MVAWMLLSTVGIRLRDISKTGHLDPPGHPVLAPRRREQHVDSHHKDTTVISRASQAAGSELP
jgi:hypothetical protein